MESVCRMNIVLIGVSGTGKTTVGKLLAERLGLLCVDLDQEIETNCQMSVEEIFRTQGETYFRSQERLAVQSVLLRHNVVVATGGGVVLLPENAEDLKNFGVVVHMKASADVIVNRLECDTTARPLLKNPDRLQVVRKMMEAREEKYRFADFAVETDQCTPEEVLEKIIGLLRSEVLSA